MRARTSGSVSLVVGALLAPWLGACSDDSTGIVIPTAGDAGADASGQEGGSESTDAGGDSAPGMTALTATSGKRLKARFVRGPEGARLFVTWFDTQLQSECRFTRFVDGSYACLPSEVTGVGEAFADDACTERVVYHYSSSGIPSMIGVVRPNKCVLAYKLVKLGDPIHPGMAYFKTGSGCTGQTLTGLDLHPIGEDAAADTFVKATAEVGTAVGQLALAILKADDGSQAPLGFFDTQNNFACSLAMAADGKARCVPETGLSASGSNFSDDACLSRLAFTYAGECGEFPFISASVTPTTCPARRSYFRNGGPTDKSYGKSKGMCVENTNASYVRYKLGAELDPASLAEGQLVVAGGSARLQQRLASTPAGALALGLYDAKYETGCSTGTARDGIRRCLLGDSLSYITYYADPWCQQERLASGLSCDGTFFRDPDGRVFRKGALVEGTVYTKDTMNVCMQTTAEGKQIYKFGEEIPAGELVAVDYQLE